MATVINPDGIWILQVLKRSNEAVPYSLIAERATLLPEVVLAHLDVLEEKGIVTSHWGKPSATGSKRLERCFELTGKLSDVLDEIDKLVKPLRA